MPMLKDPSLKYSAFNIPDVPNRQWPSQSITKAPRWLATDLRDGNQSLDSPMNTEQKRRYFDLLVRVGFTEIDVAFPSASQTEYDFTRSLVKSPGVVPDHLWLQVLAPCRKDLIRRTVDSVAGAHKVILSLYIASSETFQKTIFDTSPDQVISMAVSCIEFARSITKDDPAQARTTWNLMFSPEAFSDTDTAYSVRLCEAVKAAWGPTTENPIILNLPATVEMASPNVYADQVELFAQAISERDKVCVSLHPHNDRGCAVAAAELGQMAGAERVEGCLFGNGERTGNVDLITLALNMYTQGIDTKLDFSNLKAIRDVVEECTQIPVHCRAPYSGDMVFRAYSGSHQDAIRKGFKLWQGPQNASRHLWKVPYLPLDPEDIGSTYEAIIRINSQSGKGGVAWVLQRALGMSLPLGLMAAYSQVNKARADQLGRTMLPGEVADCFLRHYHVFSRDPRIMSATCSSPGNAEFEDAMQHVSVAICGENQVFQLNGYGEDVLSSTSNALESILGKRLVLAGYNRVMTLESGVSFEIAIVESSDGSRTEWGVNACQDCELAMLQAAMSSVAGFLRKVPASKAPDAEFNSTRAPDA